MIILGIDPGAHGAIAVLQFGVLADVLDMPVDVIKVNGTNRSRVSAPRLADLLRKTGARHAYIEQVGPSFKDGAASAFAFGRAAGLPEMGCVALGIPITLVTPQEWKKGMRCPADKDAARKRAGELFPSEAARFARVKDDGRAEAVMIALYGSSLTRELV